MRINILTLPHDEQRYDTVGDWRVLGQRKHERLEICVSDMKNLNMQVLVGVHELIEAVLCLHRGIPQVEVDRFDIAWKGEGEPGDDPAAPYHREHVFATKIERMLAEELGVDWDAYGRAVDAL